MLYRDYRRIGNNYIISNYGEVFSIFGKKVRELKSQDNTNGYLKLRVGDRHDYVHALVGEAFIGKRTGLLTYDHIDRNRMNNRADNIRLATPQQQAINKKMRRDNTSGAVGIYTAKKKYWLLEICRDGENFCQYFKKENYTLEEVKMMRDDIIAEYDTNKNLA